MINSLKIVCNGACHHKTTTTGKSNKSIVVCGASAQVFGLEMLVGLGRQLPESLVPARLCRGYELRYACAGADSPLVVDDIHVSVRNLSGHDLGCCVLVFLAIKGQGVVDGE